jgi:hypothetical protein
VQNVIKVSTCLIISCKLVLISLSFWIRTSVQIEGSIVRASFRCSNLLRLMWNFEGRWGTSRQRIFLFDSTHFEFFIFIFYLPSFDLPKFSASFFEELNQRIFKLLSAITLALLIFFSFLDYFCDILRSFIASSLLLTSTHTKCSRSKVIFFWQFLV